MSRARSQFAPSRPLGRAPVGKRSPTSLPGLYLVLQPSGARSWAVRYRISGQTAKAHPGPLSGNRSQGCPHPGQQGFACRCRRPRSRPREGAARTSVPTPSSRGQAICRAALPPCEPAAHRRGDAAAARLHVLPRWRRRLIKDITRRDVLDLLDGLVESGRPLAANRVLAAIRKLFNWAMARDIIASSPCAGVKPPSAENVRDRVLSDAELRGIWLAADKLDGPFAALTKLLLLTGQRRDEVARMAWSEVDLNSRLWTLPKERSKNGKPHDIPLSKPAVEILESLPRIGDTFVLTTDGKSASSNYGANKRAPRRAAAVRHAAVVAARPATHGGVWHGPPRRQPAGDREGFEPLVWIVRRNRRRLSAPRLCRRKAPRARVLGRACRRFGFGSSQPEGRQSLRGATDRQRWMSLPRR